MQAQAPGTVPVFFEVRWRSWLSSHIRLLISQIRRYSMFRSGLPTHPQRRTAQRDSLPRLNPLLSPCNHAAGDPVVAICADTRSRSQ